MPVNCGVSAVRVQGKRVVTLRLQRDWLCLGWLVMDAEVVEVTKTDFRCFLPAAAAVAVAVAVAAGQGEAAPTVHRRQHRGRGRVLVDCGLPWLLVDGVNCKLVAIWLIDRWN